MSYIDNMKKWLDSRFVDETTKAEIKALLQNSDELKFRFSKMLDFGTAGLRGILGAGLGMMNIYTVRYATQGLAEVLLEQGEAAKRGVCIAYDSRVLSRELAAEAAYTLAANGIRSYLFDELRPTPELSFAVRRLNAAAGINITASHNPKQYSGFKVYGGDGAQLSPVYAGQIYDKLLKIDIFEGVKTLAPESASRFITILGSGRETDEAYIKAVLEQSVRPSETAAAGDSFSLVYTPLHGSGYRLVPEVLRRAGIKNIITVPQQMKPDGEFPTLEYPNPEFIESFSLAIRLAEKNNVDLIIGTDPDADRVGVVARTSKGGYETLTGNQIGALLLDYIIKARKEAGNLPANAAAVKSIVSTEMADEICRRNGVALFGVLTGFKFIGEKIKEFEESGSNTFIFGFEESYGYLAGTYARDKDAVLGSMLIAEMACHYKNRGKSLYEAMNALYDEYGYYEDSTFSVTIEGVDADAKMASVTKTLRKLPPKVIGGLRVIRIRDYLAQTVTDVKSGASSATGLPASDVLFYELEDGSRAIIRPSGTEPKIKLYIASRGCSGEECSKKSASLAGALRKLTE